MTQPQEPLSGVQLRIVAALQRLIPDRSEDSLLLLLDMAEFAHALGANSTHSSQRTTTPSHGHVRRCRGRTCDLRTFSAMPAILSRCRIVPPAARQCRR